MVRPHPESPTPDSLRVLTLVRELNDGLGAQQFGQLLQNLLALAFKKEGFTVLRNAVGVPDLQVYGRASPEGYAIESKTGDTSITLSRRDLDGVMSTNRTPVVAAYFLSDPTPRWWLVDARVLRPMAYRRYDLESKPAVDVGFDVTAIFARLVVSNLRIAIAGPGAVARLLDE